MTLQTLFEQNKERLMSAVSGADAASAVRAMNGELDRILYTFNDQEEDARVRAAAPASHSVRCCPDSVSACSDPPSPSMASFARCAMRVI